MKRSTSIGVAAMLLVLAASVPAQLQAGDVILMTSSGLTHLRGGGATPVVPVPIDGNPLRTSWLDGSIEWVAGTSLCLAGSDLAPYGLYLLDFATSISSPTSIRLGLGVGGIRDIDVDPLTGDAFVLQNIVQGNGRIDRIPGPISAGSTLGSAFATSLTISQADYLAMVSSSQAIYGGVANIYTVMSGGTGGTAISFGSTSIFYGMESIDFDSAVPKMYCALFNADQVRQVNYFGGNSFTDNGNVLAFPEIDGPDDVEFDRSTNTIWCVARNGGTVAGQPIGVQAGNDNAIIGAVLDSAGNFLNYTFAGPVLTGHGNTGLFANIAVVGVSPASITLTGTGCLTASGVPFTLGATGLPSIGNAGFGIDITNGQPSQFTYVYLALGFSPAPIPFGQCSVYLDLATLGVFINAGVSPLGPFPLDSFGALSFPAPIPANNALIGSSLALQAAATDTVYGVVLSNGLKLNFGP